MVEVFWSPGRSGCTFGGICLQNGCYWTGTLWAGCPHQSNATASSCQRAGTEKKIKKNVSFIVVDWRSDVPKAKNWNSLSVFGLSFPHFSFQTSGRSYVRNGKCLPLLKPVKAILVSLISPSLISPTWQSQMEVAIIDRWQTPARSTSWPVTSTAWVTGEVTKNTTHIINSVRNHLLTVFL